MAEECKSIIKVEIEDIGNEIAVDLESHASDVHSILAAMTIINNVKNANPCNCNNCQVNKVYLNSSAEILNKFLTHIYSGNVNCETMH